MSNETWQIIGILVSAFSVILTYIVYFERKWRNKIIKEQQKEQEKMRTCIEKVSEQIMPAWQKHVGEVLCEYVTREEGELAQEKIFNEIERVANAIDLNHKQLIESEMFRLKGEILHFAEDLKNGGEKSSVTYQYIHDCYTRYKSLGGNSYIEQTFKYILRTMGDGDENE